MPLTVRPQNPILTVNVNGMRPLTKGAPIGLRVPLPVDYAIRQRAAALGVSPGALLAADAIAKYGAAPPTPAATRARNAAETNAAINKREPIPVSNVSTSLVPQRHSHSPAIKTGAGIWRCACGAVSTNRGTSWRML